MWRVRCVQGSSNGTREQCRRGANKGRRRSANPKLHGYLYSCKIYAQMGSIPSQMCRRSSTQILFVQASSFWVFFFWNAKSQNVCSGQITNNISTHLLHSTMHLARVWRDNYFSHGQGQWGIKIGTHEKCNNVLACMKVSQTGKPSSILRQFPLNRMPQLFYNNHADELEEPKHIVWISTKLVEPGGNFPNPNARFSCNTVKTLPIYIHNQAVMHERVQKVCLSGQISQATIFIVFPFLIFISFPYLYFFNHCVGLTCQDNKQLSIPYLIINFFIISISYIEFNLYIIVDIYFLYSYVEYLIYFIFIRKILF